MEKPIQRTIKYEADRSRGFGREIMKSPGCEELERCIQCGTCSGVCPLSIYMDHTPRRIMALTRGDFKKDVLESRTIWLCASCYACTAECPQGIRITDIMYALKQRAVRDGVYPKKFSIPILAREFYNMVKEKGRVSEMKLVERLFMKTNPLNGLKMWKLGLKLMNTGRFPAKTESIQRIDELNKMLDTLDNKTPDTKPNA